MFYILFGSTENQLRIMKSVGGRFAAFLNENDKFSLKKSCYGNDGFLMPIKHWLKPHEIGFGKH